MVIKEIREINGKKYNYTYSDSGVALRCGRLLYVDAVDPIDIDKYYFEEGVIPTDPIYEEAEGNGD